MGHNKLKKFAENETFRCLIQPSTEDVLDKESVSEGFAVKNHPVKGKWNEEVFEKPQPIVLELGCGRGEYTVDLAQRIPERNYVGVDIKGARLWKGAKYATENKLGNVGFLRTRIEFIEAFFEKDEVSEIWLTFSDPQIKSENNRLTAPGFLERYRRFLKRGGIIHLKTDSRFLHEYSKAVVMQNGLKMLACTSDLYGEGRNIPELAAVPSLFEVQTYYERMFLEMGLKITYLSFVIDKEGDFKAPEWDSDYWKAVEGSRRSFGHGQTSPSENRG